MVVVDDVVESEISPAVVVVVAVAAVVVVVVVVEFVEHFNSLPEQISIRDGNHSFRLASRGYLRKIGPHSLRKVEETTATKSEASRAPAEQIDRYFLR